MQLSNLQDEIYFDISKLEEEPIVFSLNTGDWLPNHAASDTRRD
jgi:hypothetical protein